MKQSDVAPRVSWRSGKPGRGYRSVRCEKCGLRPQLCLCSTLPALQTKTQLHLCLHAQELQKPTGSARLLRCLLPDHALHVFGGREPQALDLSQPEGAGHTLLLYPDASALPLDVVVRELDGPVRLVVPDGTWSQTRRFRKRLISGGHQAVIIRGETSRYELRKSDDEQRLCTFEAVAFALGLLEGESVQNTLFHWFDLWKAASLAARKGELECKATNSGATPAQ